MPLGNKTRGEGGSSADDASQSRRNVLRGVGGAFGAISAFGMVDGSGFETVEARIEKLRTEFDDLGDLDPDALDDAEIERLGAEGKRIRNMMGGDCGPEAYFEVSIGPIDSCCEGHDWCCVSGPPCSYECNMWFLDCVAYNLTD